MAAVGDSLLEAFQKLETLDFCARTQMYAARIGQYSTLDDAQIAMFNHRENNLAEFDPQDRTSRERELRGQIVEIIQRAYDRQLMISTEGVVSARLDADSFLITPTGKDRKTIDNRDIVLIRGGKRESGKLPSRSVMLHATIYSRHPDVNSIITAQSPYATAYTISEQPMQTRTIPESYIMLRDVPRVPYGAQFADHERLAEQISSSRPVLLIQNDCVMTLGESILQAFDRLEVAEFTARSLIDTTRIGELVPIGSQEIEDLEAKFFD
jgi:L-fuculose-phosphate aldolase